jgi:tetratricopeptide (TPR) repeat protein
MPEQTSPRSSHELRDAAAGGPARRSVLLGAGGLTLLLLAVFAPVLGFPFVELDVPTQVFDNPYVHGLSAENLKHIFTAPSTTTSYYPVRTLSYAIDYQLWGLNPLGFKLTNVLVHLCCVLLVYALILRLMRDPAAAGTMAKPWWDTTLATFGAAIFAVHPVVVEPVSWVAGREELLMTLGALGCFHLHLTARRLQAAGASGAAVPACHAGAALCCVAACLSNAVGAVIPLLITAWDLLMLERPRLRKVLFGTSALWIVGAVTVVVKIAASRKELLAQPVLPEQVRTLSAVIQKLGYGSEFIVGEGGTWTIERVMLVLNVYWLNLQSLFWPAKLGICYGPVTARSFFEPDVLLGAGAVALTCLVLWAIWRRKLVVFPLLWFLLALVPSAQIMPHHVHRADRFLYLPLVGLAVAAAMSLRPLENLLKRPAIRIGAIVAGILTVLLLATLAAVQVQTWRSSITVWENCIRVGPKNISGHRNLAHRLVEAGQYTRAFSHYEIASRMNADNIAALNEFARYLINRDNGRQPDYDLACRLAKWACELAQWKDPESRHTLALVYNNYAVELSDGLRFAEAVEYYQKACQADPRYEGPVFNLALLLAACSDPSLRRPDEAVRLAEKACGLVTRPRANHLMILSLAYAEAGRLDEAISAMEEAIGLAEATGETGLAEQLQRQLTRYRELAPGEATHE